MAQRAVYRPRDAEHTVLHQVIAEHLEVFLRAVAEAGDGACPSLRPRWRRWPEVRMARG
jgi:hypothetical protein